MRKQRVENDVPDPIFIYPNPTGEMLFIKGIDQGTEIILYNIRGDKILRTTGKQEICVSSLSSGVYIARFVNGNRVINKMFVKK